MKESSANTIMEYATVDVSIDEGYSGRYMFGEMTHAIHTGSILGLCQDLAETALLYIAKEATKDEPTAIAILEAMADMKRWDSAGEGVVIY